MYTKYDVKLTGVIGKDSTIPAKTHQAKEVTHFKGVFSDGTKVTITKQGNDAIVETTKGRYILTHHPSLNIFKGNCQQVRVEVTLKQVAGTLRYWKK